MRELTISKEVWKTKIPFHITGKTFNDVDLLYVEIKENDYIGRGEGAGIFYFGENIESMYADVERVRDDIENGISRVELLSKLDVGGARNALDCALWDLEAKQSKQSIWQMIDMEMKPVITVNTIGIDSAENMANAAKDLDTSIIKVKLDANQPIEKMTSICASRPDADIIVDVNQGWTFEQLVEYAPVFESLGVLMIEQPLPRGEDFELRGYKSPIQLCADESCISSDEVLGVVGSYQMINIKLDKAGGLTEALTTAETAKRYGLKIMVGNMLGTSLSMAPSFVIAQLCDFVDIDGPVLLSDDRSHAIDFAGGHVSGFNQQLWG